MLSFRQHLTPVSYYGNDICVTQKHIPYSVESFTFGCSRWWCTGILQACPFVTYDVCLEIFHFGDLTKYLLYHYLGCSHFSKIVCFNDTSVFARRVSSFVTESQTSYSRFNNKRTSSQPGKLVSEQHQHLVGVEPFTSGAGGRIIMTSEDQLKLCNHHLKNWASAWT